MEVLDFCSKHIQQAKRLIRENYQEERQAVPVLPTVGELPGLDELAENGLGCAAFEKGEMVGFLACLNPWENAFTTTARGIFLPFLPMAQSVRGALRFIKGCIRRQRKNGLMPVFLVTLLACMLMIMRQSGRFSSMGLVCDALTLSAL